MTTETVSVTQENVRTSIDIPCKMAMGSFSPVLGGPVFPFFRKTRLSGPALELLHRRILVISSITWLPLVLLTLIQRHHTAGIAALQFWSDIDAQVKLLVCIPLLLAAEVFAHDRVFPLVKNFVSRRIITEDEEPKFDAAVDSAVKLRDSAVPEWCLLILVYTIGLVVWRYQLTAKATWYALPDGEHMRLTIAGAWYAFVSIPIFQFIYLRWYWRIIVWHILLGRISRLRLQLIATHPDHAAGLGFTGYSTYGFLIFMFAQGCMVSSKVAEWVMYDRTSLSSLELLIASFLLFFLAFIFAPLLLFVPKMEAAKRKGLGDYGLVSSKYVLGFDQRWVRREYASDSIVGTSDIQSLADMANSFAVVSLMRVVPFGIKDVTKMVGAAVVPLLPLALFVMPVKDLIKLIAKFVL